VSLVHDVIATTAIGFGVGMAIVLVLVALIALTMKARGG
jgi:hypothetical protein